MSAAATGVSTRFCHSAAMKRSMVLALVFGSRLTGTKVSFGETKDQNCRPFSMSMLDGFRAASPRGSVAPSAIHFSKSLMTGSGSFPFGGIPLSGSA